MTTRKLALFGGTFDPIHLGHTIVAGAAATEIEADRVIFIPAKCSPLKGYRPAASDEERLNMIHLAIEGNDAFDVNDCELRRAAPSYTLDTVRQFRSEHGPDTALHWLIGADMIDDLIHWYRIEELIDACNLTIMYRGGYEPPAFDKYTSLWTTERIEKLRANVIQTPSIDISSTQVRRRLGTGQDVRNMLDPAVADYIRRRGLYTRI